MAALVLCAARPCPPQRPPQRPRLHTHTALPTHIATQATSTATTTATVQVAKLACKKLNQGFYAMGVTDGTGVAECSGSAKLLNKVLNKCEANAKTTHTLNCKAVGPNVFFRAQNPNEGDGLADGMEQVVKQYVGSGACCARRHAARTPFFWRSLSISGSTVCPPVAVCLILCPGTRMP